MAYARSFIVLHFEFIKILESWIKDKWVATVEWMIKFSIGNESSSRMNHCPTHKKLSDEKYLKNVILIPIATLEAHNNVYQQWFYTITWNLSGNQSDLSTYENTYNPQAKIKNQNSIKLIHLYIVSWNSMIMQ